MQERWFASHKRTVLSSPPETTRSPAGLKRAARTQLLWPLSVSLNFCPAMLHILMVLSSEAVRSVVESGEKATHRTPPVCALMTLDRPLLMFGAHRRTVRSFEPVAMMPPVGVTATDRTGPCTHGRKSPSCRGIPGVPLPVAPPLCYGRGAGRAEEDSRNRKLRLGIALKSAQRRAMKGYYSKMQEQTRHRARAHLVIRKAEGTQLWLKVPDHEAAVLRARDKLLHVRVEGYTVDGILVTAKRALERRILPHFSSS